MKKIKVINGIEVYGNEILTLSVNGKVVLHSDAKHFEKLAKSVLKQEGVTNINDAYKALLNVGEVGNITFDSIFINEIIYN